MRFVTEQVPVQNAAAFMPNMHRSVKSSSYGLVKVFGQPGTEAIASPKPDALPPISAIAQTQSSYVSPDLIFPDLYRASVQHMHAPVSLYRDNQMPVPARKTYRLANVAMGAPKLGGRSQIPWPRTFQSWPPVQGT